MNISPPLDRSRRILGPVLGALAALILLAWPSDAAETSTTAAQGSALTEKLRALNAEVLPIEQRQRSTQMLRDYTRARLRAVNQQDRAAWTRIRSREDWENWKTPRVAALRRSLGIFPDSPKNLNVQITRTLEGDGYRIENLVYESRPDLFVTANLYVPSPVRSKMPGIVIIHSHHNPKTQGELQDMGMTWARQGCLVLVMDQLSYGERRQHPAGNRQDYRFRYINGLQLHVIGDSLTGWMAWDVMRGVDLLLARAGIDRDKIILIGSVAGGGDPAAVTAALDPRITCVVPFNFGGPQPETTYPLPADAEQTFNYLGGGSWESTRNLRRSGSDGFLPWLIVGSLAPRRLIYGHEFSWDRERDPVWARLQTIFGFYNKAENLSFAHGAGLLQGQPPEATHCNNVGAVHRKLIHPALERWFNIPIPQEFQNRRPPEELASLPPNFKPRPLHELYRAIGSQRAAAARVELQKLQAPEQRARLRQQWSALLGDVEPRQPRVVSRVSEPLDPGAANPVALERVVLETEPGIIVPVLLARPTGLKTKPPVVVGLSQQGKSRFLTERAPVIAELLASGVAVCLPDVRGTGETSPAGARHYRSEATSLSSSEQMLGGTLLGARLKDLRSIVQSLAARDDLDGRRLAVWGESFAAANLPGFSDPLLEDGDAGPPSEPLGGLLALFGALFEDNARAVIANGTLAGYQAMLRDRFCYVPHDAIVPGALNAGDLSDVAAALAPRPLRLARLVDGRNVLMDPSEVRALLAPAIDTYRSNQEKMVLLPSAENNVASWLVTAISTER